MSAAPTQLFAALSATWPGAEMHERDGFTLRRSAGGGNRVRAATLPSEDAPGGDAIDRAAAAMRAWDQAPLFLVRADQSALDDQLSAMGYARRDPTLLMTGPLAPLLDIETPRLSTFELWPPLAIMDEIWQAGGIGPDRRAVMARCPAPKTAVFGREADRPAATAFAAVAGDVAMVHALEVRPIRRRRGVARRMMGRAAQWAAAQGGRTMAVAVTEANTAAIALYAALGMQPAARYHYRCLEGGTR